MNNLTERFCDVDDWSFHSVSLCLSPFSVYYLCRFVNVWIVKQIGWTRCTIWPLHNPPPAHNLTSCQIVGGQFDKLSSLSSGTFYRKWNLSPQVELFTYKKIWRRQKKIWEMLAQRRRCLRDFSVIFWRVPVCLKSVFSDGQDVKYDRDITPTHIFFTVQTVTSILLTGTTELIKHQNEEAGTLLIVTACLASRTVCSLLRRIHQRRSNTTKSKSGLSLWTTSQNDSGNIFLNILPPNS